MRMSYINSSDMDFVLRLTNIQHVWVAAALLLLTSEVSASLDNCQTLRTEIRVTKEKTYEYNGRRIRLYCTGEVPMNKCEGSCTSQVSPSVVHFPGFKKVSVAILSYIMTCQ